MKHTNDQTLAALHGWDHEYVATLMQYLRSDFTKDPQAVEAVLADLLEGFVAAQQDGVSAKQYFEADPQTAADAILQELPKRRLGQYFDGGLLWLQLCAAFIGISGLVRWPFAWQVVDLQFLVVPLVFFIASWFFRGISFNQLSHKTQRNMGVGCLAIAIVYGGLFWLGKVYGSTMSIPRMAIVIGLALIIICTVIGGLRGDGWQWLPSWGLMAIALALPAQTSTGLRVVVAIAVVIAMLGAYLVALRQVHRQNGGR